MNLEENRNFYLNDQLDFDKTLIKYRYQTIKPFFSGKYCLEMGPADGVMTKFLTDDFVELDIVDCDQYLLDSIPDNTKIRKFYSLFEEFNPVRTYDTILMDHILEHINNPYEILKKVYTWLNPNGILISGVPNAKSFHRLAAVKMGLLKSEYDLNDRDMVLGHKRVYDIDSFSDEFFKIKFKIRYSGGIFFKPLSNYQINSQWSKEMIEGFYELGKEFPRNAADIFIVATK